MWWGNRFSNVPDKTSRAGTGAQGGRGRAGNPSRGINYQSRKKVVQSRSPTSDTGLSGERRGLGEGRGFDPLHAQ